MSIIRQPLTLDELRAAIEMAGDKELLLDQKGRTWGNWRAYDPERAARCRACGTWILEGYCLLPEANIKICSRHVEKRWF